MKEKIEFYISSWKKQGKTKIKLKKKQKKIDYFYTIWSFRHLIPER